MKISKRMKRLLVIIIVLALIITLYFLWAYSERELVENNVETGELYFSEQGDSLSGSNFIAIQAFMLPQDYQSEITFYNKLDFYLQQAKLKNWLSNKTIVVFPEYLGTWLVVAEEKQSIYRNKTIEQGLSTMVLSNIFSFVKAYMFAKEEDRVKDAVFRMKAQKMATIYSKVFSQLSKKYGVYIVGGSIILPKPVVENNKITVGKGNLFNISFLFHPDGKIDNKFVLKVYPTADEQTYISAGKLNDIPIFETSAGKLGIAVCADSWYPDVYSHFKNNNAEIIAVPSFSIPEGIMNSLWNGYSGYPEPKGVELTDIKSITEKQAWEKYALLGRAKSYHFRAGINVFMRGQLWDLSSDGQTYSFLQNMRYIENSVNASMISCLWF